ncbi:response regulator [Methylobacterium oxalidis]|uniref:response regulator n=1 Tax=Methylobacterium oxalidis TaxID=944322 RepID=UPI003316426E
MSETGSKPVLVVDDSFAVLTIVRSVLQQLGFEDIDEARDGSEALELLRERHYSLVISDWNMEPMSGYDLLRQVRADERLRTMPFIMMTIDTDPEKMIAAKRAGVNTCLIKPFNAAVLREKITSVVHRRKPCQANLN